MQGYGLIVDFRYARRHAMLIHLEKHALGGLAHIHLYSGDPQKFANVGGEGDMATRILEGRSLDTFMWGRLHSQVIAPGEFINLNKRLLLAVNNSTSTLSAGGWLGGHTHTPRIGDLKHEIVFMTQRPMNHGDPVRITVRVYLRKQVLYWYWLKAYIFTTFLLVELSD